MHRGMKRFLYGVLYLLVFVAIVAGIYFIFIKPAPTCFDNVKNQNEEGIDCGGVCAKDCAINTLHPITAPDGVRVFPLDPAHASVLVHVVNPNTTYGVPQLSYHLTLYDEEGTSLLVASDTTFLHAGEDSYVFLPIVNVAPDKVARGEFITDAPQWVMVMDFLVPKVKVNTFKTIRDTREIRVEGVVENDDTVPLVSIRAL